jgi:hypothetical protein
MLPGELYGGWQWGVVGSVSRGLSRSDSAKRAPCRGPGALARHLVRANALLPPHSCIAGRHTLAQYCTSCRSHSVQGSCASAECTPPRPSHFPDTLLRWEGFGPKRRQANQANQPSTQSRLPWAPHPAPAKQAPAQPPTSPPLTLSPDIAQFIRKQISYSASLSMHMHSTMFSTSVRSMWPSALPFRACCHAKSTCWLRCHRRWKRWRLGSSTLRASTCAGTCATGMQVCSNGRCLVATLAPQYSCGGTS